jgi:hypothetical protein
LDTLVSCMPRVVIGRACSPQSPRHLVASLRPARTRPKPSRPSLSHFACVLRKEFGQPIYPRTTHGRQGTLFRTSLAEAFRIRTGLCRCSNRSLFAGANSAGKRIGEARDWAGFFGDTCQFQAVETARSRVSGGKAAESQRLFRPRQETGIAQEIVSKAT